METLISRLLEIAWKNKISHLSSSLTALSILDEIYSKKQEEDVVILSQGHAGLALYVVLEKYFNCDAEAIYLYHGPHPHMDEMFFCSTGSLGMGLPIAVGAALANKKRHVYCVISDGECYEGSIWESLQFLGEHNLQNITVYVNMNGYRAYGAIDKTALTKRLKAFYPSITIKETNVDKFNFLSGINAHYHVPTQKDFNEWRQQNAKKIR